MTVAINQALAFIFAMAFGMFMVDMIAQDPMQKTFDLDTDAVTRRITMILGGLIISVGGVAFILFKTSTTHAGLLISLGFAAGVIVNSLIVISLLKSHQNSGKDPKQK